MGLEEPPLPFYGGIVRSGVSGSYTYSVTPGREDRPVNYVGWYDALRFANWLDNGQPVGPQGNATTEDGAYTITLAGILANDIGRNPGAEYFIPSEDEWYKAAYYNPVNATWFDYPTSSNAAPTCDAPSGSPNRANCDGPGTDAFDADVDNLTDVGSFPGSGSPYGTFDQAGNVWEWNERILGSGSTRGVRGGSFAFLSSYTAASTRDACSPACGVVNYGIRVATSVPEPGRDALLIAGLLGVACAGRRRALTGSGPACVAPAPPLRAGGTAASAGRAS
jgi:formylglycine-generating enzyme required for sulfatase activity